MRIFFTLIHVRTFCFIILGFLFIYSLKSFEKKISLPEDF